MVDAILAAHGFLAYLLVFAALMAGSIGIPAPEDLTLIAAGVLCSLSQVNTWIMALTCYVGLILGDLIIYRIGWMTGPKLFRKKWFRRHISTKRLNVMRTNLHKRTMMTILIARHLFYIRTATFLMCGAVRISFARFVIMDAIAALITTPLMMGIGYIFANNYDAIIKYLRDVKFFLLAIGLVAAVFIFRRYRRSRSESDEAFDVDPLSESTADQHETAE
jgi:membrane protein DedA with SNARE-associated domain